jgi:hypothetical protein
MKTDEQLTKIIAAFLGTTRDLCDWGGERGLVSPEELRLTITGRKELTKVLAANGMSQREIAKQTGVTRSQVQRDLDGPKRAKDGPKRAKEPEPELTVEDDLERDEYREAFLLRTADCLSFAVYSGTVDQEVIAAAKRVMSKWQEFTQILEQRYAETPEKNAAETSVLSSPGQSDDRQDHNG